MPSSPEPCPPVVLRFDGRARLAGFSPAAADLLGVDAAALGTPLARVAAERLEPALADAAAAVQRDGTAYRAAVRDRAGRRWRVELCAERTVADEPGLLLTLAPAPADETGPPRRAEATFAEVMADADLAAALVDPDGTLRWANTTLANLLGEAATALVGADWLARCVPADRRAGLAHRLACARAGGRAWRAEAPLVTAAGGRRQLAWHALPVGAGAGAGLALVGHDVTAEQRARRTLEAAGAAAEQASALKSRVLAAVAHDLRRPLQTLRFVHDVLARTVVEPAGHEVVGVLADTVATMARAVDLLVEVSRRAPLDATPHPTTVALGELLAAVRARFADAAAAKGLGLVVVRTSARVRSDAAVLARVLDELVAAAIRHTETGRVVIGCRRRGDGVVLEVVDTRATAPLAELAAAVGGGEPATRDGLGLVRQLDALAGHRLELRTVLGRGAVFALHLPAADEAVSPHPPLPEGDVLLVADDVAERDSIARLLELEGYHVVAAKDADGALAQLDGRPAPRVAVVDRRPAPGVEATALARRLGERAGTAVAVVALADAAPAEPPPAGANRVRFLTKPTDPKALLALVAELTAATGGATACPWAAATDAATTETDDARFVAVIAADSAARERLVATVRAAGHPAAGFADTAALLAGGDAERVGCVVLDMGAGGRAGVAEVAALGTREVAPPVVVLHPGDDVALAVAAMRAGAFDVLARPVVDDVLVETLRLALREGARRERRLEAEVETRHRFDRLTPRERDVLRLVVTGRSNKEVAQALGISPRTVENHRARIMEKTGIHSLAELVAAARHAGFEA